MANDNIHTRAVFAIVPIKRPTSGETYGTVMVIATPNRERFDPSIQDYVQSFAKKWRITESCPFGTDGPTMAQQTKWIERQESWHKVAVVGAARG